MVSGADDAEALAEFGDVHKDWFAKFLDLPHGTPSQDTFLRVFAAIDPKVFQVVFIEWMAEMRVALEGAHVAIDGKTLRHSFDTASGGKSIHMVSAWLSGQGLVLGQVKVAEKANEIVAIPSLLKLLDVRQVTVTIDAMGCQRAIAEQLVDSGAKYVLAVKENQPTLHEHISAFFRDAARTDRALDDPAPALEHHSEVDAGHGRVETRTCHFSRDLSWIGTCADWKGLDGIALVTRERTNKTTSETSKESAYYIVSHSTATAATIAHCVRDHWGIENSLHWVLDMTFDEDSSRIRTGNAAQNIAIIRHAALNLLRAAPGKKKSIALRRKRCGWDQAYLLTVLAGREAA